MIQLVYSSISSIQATFATEVSLELPREYVGTVTEEVLAWLGAFNVTEPFVERLLLPILVHGLGESSAIRVTLPEIGLNPEQQLLLADFFIQSGKDWMLETQSEMVIIRIRKQIRKGKFPSSNLKINVLYENEDGPQNREIRLDEDGDFLDCWPGGFFEQRYNELLGKGD